MQCEVLCRAGADHVVLRHRSRILRAVVGAGCRRESFVFACDAGSLTRSAAVAPNE